MVPKNQIEVQKVGLNIVLLHVGWIWSYPVVVWDLRFIQRDLTNFLGIFGIPVFYFGFINSCLL